MTIGPKTKIATTADTSSVSSMQVDEDGDGVYEIAYQAKANSAAEQVNNSWIAMLVSVVAIAAVAAIAVLFARKLRRKSA